MHGTITVNPFDVSTASSLPAATVGKAYSTMLKAGGGEAPLMWKLVSGHLPAGLNLSSSGKISGTPTATGTSTFVVKVKDSSSPVLTAKKTLSIKVS